MNKPNSDWVSVPYEESGIVSSDLLKETVSHFAERFKSFTISIEHLDDGMFKFHLKQN